MRQTKIFNADNQTGALSMVSSFFEIFRPSEKVRVILESESEFSLTTNSIRGYYWGFVVPNAAELILGEKKMTIQNDKALLNKIHVKLKMLVLPTKKYHVIEDGRPVERECVGSMKNATVREWYSFIRCVYDFLLEHYGVDLDQVTPDGYDDFVALANRLEKDVATQKKLGENKKRFEKNLQQYSTGES